MAEMTLLELTQNVLSSMSSDEVNSIGDTVESLQVANIIKNKYYDIVARGQLPEQAVLFQLNPSNDATAPVSMYLPDGITSIKWLKYFDSNVDDGSTIQTDQFGAFSHDLNTDLVNQPPWATTSTTSNAITTGAKSFTVGTFTVGSSSSVSVGAPVQITSSVNSLNSMFGTVSAFSGSSLSVNVTSVTGSGTLSSWSISGGSIVSAAPGYKYVTILPIDQFLDMVNRFNTTDTNVDTYTFTEGANSFTFNYFNNKQPQYCTVIENFYVLFDSFDGTLENTLQAEKTMAWGEKVTPFQMVDTFIPDMDDYAFPLLLNEAKALAFYELKGQPHALAEQEKKRQWSQVQKNKSISNKPNYFDQLPNMGRMPRTGGYSGGGYGAYKWMRQAGS